MLDRAFFVWVSSVLYSLISFLGIISEARTMNRSIINDRQASIMRPNILKSFLHHETKTAKDDGGSFNQYYREILVEYSRLFHFGDSHALFHALGVNMRALVSSSLFRANIDDNSPILLHG